MDLTVMGTLPDVKVIIFSSPSPKLVGEAIDKFKVFPWQGTYPSKNGRIWQAVEKCSEEKGYSLNTRKIENNKEANLCMQK